MNRVIEMFGISTREHSDEIVEAIHNQSCPYTGKKCIKTRKSQSSIAIGTCTVEYGKANGRIIICPFRLLQHNQIFFDCIHLLTNHEPGNQLFVVPEVSIPGGSVDYFLVSARDKKVCDFIGIELQTMDTTGTVWPERQRFLQSIGLKVDEADAASSRPFGINWKMTAKTILLQMHHKAETFECINKHLVLVIQSQFYTYMQKEFSFDHIGEAKLGDTVHFHMYGLRDDEKQITLAMEKRTSTDVSGMSKCLGLQAQPQIELTDIIRTLESKLTDDNRLRLINSNQ